MLRRWAPILCVRESVSYYCFAAHSRVFIPFKMPGSRRPVHSYGFHSYCLSPLDHPKILSPEALEAIFSPTPPHPPRLFCATTYYSSHASFLFPSSPRPLQVFLESYFCLILLTPQVIEHAPHDAACKKACSDRALAGPMSAASSGRDMRARSAMHRTPLCTCRMLNLQAPGWSGNDVEQNTRAESGGARQALMIVREAVEPSHTQTATKSVPQAPCRTAR